MMLKGSVPIDHKEDDKGERQIHYKEHPSASTVFYKLCLHFFARCIFSCVSDKEEAHSGKADIIGSERIEPEGAVIKAKPQLENAVESIPRKGAVK